MCAGGQKPRFAGMSRRMNARLEGLAAAKSTVVDWDEERQRLIGILYEQTRRNLS